MLKKLFRSELFPIFILTLIGVVLYSIRLPETIELASDFGRDTLRALELWQHKELTLIGSPLAINSLPGHTVFFTSVSLYLGMFGLLFTNFHPAGTVLANIVLTGLSIPIFYLLSRRLTSSIALACFATIIYALSPMTVFYARFFWTPNTLIPLSVFFWYLVTLDKKKYDLLSGILAGGMFLIHYASIIAIGAYLLGLLVTRQTRKFATVTAGTIIGIIPLLLFEVKNHFYLLSSLILNLQQGATSTGNLDQGSIVNTVAIFFSAIFGLRSADLTFTTLVNSPLVTNVGSLIFFVLFLRELYLVFRDPRKRIFAFTVSFTLLILLLGKNVINIRYQFFNYPLIILFAGSMLWRTKSKLLIAVCLFFLLGTTFKIVSHTQGSTQFAYPISTLEQISQIIVRDDYRKSYNITQTVTGDAQAIDLRFFVLRDSVNKPQNQYSYINLEGLYVVARSLPEIYTANRWEFTATPGLEPTQSWPVGDLTVYKFERK